jgi:S-adenosylmethionine decarboxylase proenzyme
VLNFRQFIEADYCEGLSINADFFWDPKKDVSFLTVGQSHILTNLFQQAAQAGMMKIVDTRLTKYGASPEFGFTYLVVLGQSHIMIHSWPEKHLLNIDVFTCGTEGNPLKILDYVKNALKPDKVRTNQYQRGIRKDVENASEQPDPPQAIHSV